MRIFPWLNSSVKTELNNKKPLPVEESIYYRCDSFLAKQFC